MGAKGVRSWAMSTVIYDRLDAWGYAHERVCHGSGEYARDDGDSVCEVHTNTTTGFWSLLRS